LRSTLLSLARYARTFTVELKVRAYFRSPGSVHQRSLILYACLSSAILRAKIDLMQPASYSSSPPDRDRKMPENALTLWQNPRSRPGLRRALTVIRCRRHTHRTTWRTAHESSSPHRPRLRSPERACYRQRLARNRPTVVASTLARPPSAGHDRTTQGPRQSTHKILDNLWTVSPQVEWTDLLVELRLQTHLHVGECWLIKMERAWRRYFHRYGRQQVVSWGPMTCLRL
jgi:hypothetical protein